MNQSTRAARLPRSTINSWSDLAKLIEAVAAQQQNWIFRGEPSTTNELRPAAGRQGSGGTARRRRRYDPADERDALKRFRNDARPYVTHGGYSDLEWLAIAQHHGMATRLLDWSESLLVAAFFAVEQAGKQGHALIYGIYGLPVVDPRQVTDPFELQEVCIYRPPHISERIAAQRSLFTIHPDPTAAFAHPNLTTWKVTRRACSQLKWVLDSCAVNYASLFPNLEGLAAHIGWRYKWGMSQGHVA
jgi:hypothetical protein